MAGFNESQMEWLNELCESLGIDELDADEELVEALLSTAAENNVSPDEITRDELERFAEAYEKPEASDCPLCYGTGYIKEDFPNPIGSGIITEASTCHACNGSGKKE